MANKKFKFSLKTRKIEVVLDKLLLLQLFKKLNGRFWGIYGLVALGLALSLCFYIKPELRDQSTAFSDFGLYVQTIPYFTAGLFAASYGLWRWRNYLSKSSKKPELTTLFLTLIVVGLYMVAFLPVGLNETIDYLHYLGVAIAGVGMVTTVTVDLMLRKAKAGPHKFKWQFVRIISLLMIATGLAITLLSANRFGQVIHYALYGEIMILAGFGVWVIIRTYQGEGVRTGFSRALNKVLIIK